MVAYVLAEKKVLLVLMDLPLFLDWRELLPFEYNEDIPLL